MPEAANSLPASGVAFRSAERSLVAAAWIVALADMRQDQREDQEPGGDRSHDAADAIPARGPSAPASRAASRSLLDRRRADAGGAGTSSRDLRADRALVASPISRLHLAHPATCASTAARSCADRVPST